MSQKTDPSNMVYQLKITLRDSKPPIWRRLLVFGGISLYELNKIIQVAMGWTNSHLHQFIIDGAFYSIPSDDDWEPVIDERDYQLSQMAPSEKSRFIYEYDFGDSWKHEVVVEKIMPPESRVKYPKCIQGRRKCPPEDVGGIWGYETFLEALRDPQHNEHDSYKEWWGGAFDPEAFDMDEVNRMMQHIDKIFFDPY